MGTCLLLKYDLSTGLWWDFSGKCEFAAKVCDHTSVGMACWLKCCPKAQEPGCYSCLYCWPLGDPTQAPSSGFYGQISCNDAGFLLKHLEVDGGGTVC